MDVFDDEAEESLLFHLVYCSRSSAQLADGDIDGIVAAAQRHNAQHGITGWLVYSSGIFFQWLEGGQDEVRRLMTAIAADSRHDSIVVLSEDEEMRERLFAEWDMEWVSPADIRVVLVDAMDSSNDPKIKKTLLQLTKDIDSKSPRR